MGSSVAFDHPSMSSCRFLELLIVERFVLVTTLSASGT